MNGLGGLGGFNITGNSYSSPDNSVICQLTEDRIFQINGIEKKCVGVSIDLYNNMSAQAETYYNRLVELGDIVIPKTQEELTQEALEEQKAINRQMMGILQAMEARLNKAENINNENNNKEDGVNE